MRKDYSVPLRSLYMLGVIRMYSMCWKLKPQNPEVLTFADEVFRKDADLIES